MMGTRRKKNSKTKNLSVTTQCLLKGLTIHIHEDVYRYVWNRKTGSLCMYALFSIAMIKNDSESYLCYCDTMQLLSLLFHTSEQDNCSGC